MLAGWCMRGAGVPGFSGCSGWDLSDCLNTGPTVRHRSRTAGIQLYQRNQRSGPAWLQEHIVSIRCNLVPCRPWGDWGPKDSIGQGEKPELVHPGFCQLPVGDSQREWRMYTRLCQDFMSYTWSTMWKCSPPFAINCCIQKPKVCISFPTSSDC